MKSVGDIMWGENGFEPFGPSQEIASLGFPDGGELFCKNCQTYKRLTVGEIAETIVKGIPRCCGVRMGLEALTGLWI